MWSVIIGQVGCPADDRDGSGLLHHLLVSCVLVRQQWTGSAYHRAMVHDGVGGQDPVEGQPLLPDDAHMPTYDSIAGDRRQFLQLALLTATAGMVTRTPVAVHRHRRLVPTPTLLGPIRQVNAGVLNVGYVEHGPASGPPVILLHGWPYDIHSFEEVVPLLEDAGYRVIVPYLRGFGSTRFRYERTPRNAQQSALAVDTIALMDALNVPRAVVAGFDWGARTAAIVAALWPERCSGLVSVSGYLIGNRDFNRSPLPPAAELSWWYQYYFSTDRGRAGYEKYRREFARLIWQLASPQWAFDDDTFERSAASLDNPDHVDIVIHNYRWRLSLADGERQFDKHEERLASAPPISVPTVTLEGDANGAPHPVAKSYAARFTGKYVHRVIAGGVGHNLPQEAPGAFVEAINEVTRL